MICILVSISLSRSIYVLFMSSVVIIIIFTTSHHYNLITDTLVFLDIFVKISASLYRLAFV